MHCIDFRSDTVTKPSKAMRRVMAEAAVGDDVYGEDPTVNRLEEYAAALLGKEAALYASSGTQTNLLALLSHCQRGDEYIVGQLAHTYKYEAGGAAVLGSIQPQPLDLEADGTFDLEKVARTIKPDDYHFARTKLLCLENTHNGLALPMEYLSRARALGKKHGLKIHLDGARIFNAAVKTGVDAALIAGCADSVSVCLSKGLGAPVGSVLCADRRTIDTARRWRKMLGGGMRQAGILAAAGIFALENNRERLQQDHDHAKILAEGLGTIAALRVDYVPAQTNMVFVTLPPEAVDTLKSSLAGSNVLIPAGQKIRLVTHLDIDRDGVELMIGLMQTFFS
jgi:threonine aldolase